MNAIVVTAANEPFAPRLKELIESLLAASLPQGTTLGCLDVGLSFETRDWLATRGVERVVPEWDIALDASQRAEKPWLRAFTARPFLRDYFPGRAAYLWMDADCWVQQGVAVRWFFDAASGGGLAIVPHTDRCYVHRAGQVQRRAKNLADCFGEGAVERLLVEPYYDSGVFALERDVPHWDAWARRFRQGVERAGGQTVCDRTAINYACWTDGLPVRPLPARCNWLCHLGTPAYDPADGLFKAPGIPWEPIGILHLSARENDATVVCSRPGRGAERVRLRFGAVRPRLDPAR